MSRVETTKYIGDVGMNKRVGREVRVSWFGEFQTNEDSTISRIREGLEILRSGSNKGYKRKKPERGDR